MKNVVRTLRNRSSRIITTLGWCLVLNFPVFALWSSSVSYIIKTESFSEGLTYLSLPPPMTPAERKFWALHPINHDLPRDTESSSLQSLQQELDDLLSYMVVPKVRCRKRVRLGGHSCNKTSDGDKIVCLNRIPTRRKTKPCIVYSFGSAQDFSFDKAIGEFGCEVYTFDEDPYQADIWRDVAPRVHFLHLRLASTDKVEVQKVRYETLNMTQPFLYRPLDNIMLHLRHYNATLDYLKIDVDGPEWDILENSVFKTLVLERTRQLALEVHLEAFLKTNQGISDYKSALRRYKRVFKGLEDRGFQLANYEPNFYGPEVALLAGRVIPIYAEQLWLNARNHKAAFPSKPTEQDFNRVEVI